eukprot:2376772-Rhodomonas_salina.2
MAVELRISHPHLLAMLHRPEPHCRARQIPTEKDAFDATIIVGAVKNQLVLAREKARAIASPDLDIVLQILTKVMPLQATPGRRAASHSPIIVDATEMFKSPRPEASSRANSDTLGMAVSFELRIAASQAMTTRKFAVNA